LAGIQRLLLHGETRPYDTSSSQSNQRFVLRAARISSPGPLGPTIRAEALRWRRRSQSLARPQTCRESFLRSRARDFSKRIFILAYWTQAN